VQKAQEVTAVMAGSRKSRSTRTRRGQLFQLYIQGDRRIDPKHMELAKTGTFLFYKPDDRAWDCDDEIHCWENREI
jgi:hypothetical protein